MYRIGEARFDVGLQRINSLSNAWNIYTAPGALAALWVTEQFGLRGCLLAGYSSQLLCVLLAHLACVLPLAQREAFNLLYASQAVGALGQPLFLNNVTLLAGAWFPASERDAAVAVSLLFVAAGSVFISIYAPLAVTQAGQMDRLYGWQVPVWAAVLAAGLVFTADEPPLPPSASAAVMRSARRQRHSRSSERWDALRTAASQAAQLLWNANFMVLNLSSSILTGLVFLLGTVVGQLTAGCSESDETAGMALAALSAMSGVAVLLYLYLLRDQASGEAHPYVKHQLGWSALCAMGTLVVLAMARPGVSAGVTIASWGVLGLASGTLINGALTMEHAAEMTFPLPANVSVALLAVTSSIVSFLQVVIGTQLLEAPASVNCLSAATPFAAFCALSCAAGLALLGLLKADYRRAEMESQSQGQEDRRVGSYGATDERT